MAVFRGKMLAAIHLALACGALTLPESMGPQPLLNLLNRLGHPKKTKWNVHIRERYRHGAGVVTYLARYVRGGPIKNARLVAWDGERVTFTCRPRQEEADGDTPSPQRLTLAVADFLQRWLLHVPLPQTRVVRSYGLYHPSRAATLAVCRAALGQPPLVILNHFDNWKIAPGGALAGLPDEARASVAAFPAEVTACAPATTVVTPEHFATIVVGPEGYRAGAGPKAGS